MVLSGRETLVRDGSQEQQGRRGGIGSSTSSNVPQPQAHVELAPPHSDSENGPGKGASRKSLMSRDSRESKNSGDSSEIAQTVQNKRESDHSLEIQENLDSIREVPPVKRPFLW